MPAVVMLERCDFLAAVMPEQILSLYGCDACTTLMPGQLIRRSCVALAAVMSEQRW
jgi:hypothetical protein